MALSRSAGAARRGIGTPMSDCTSLSPRLGVPLVVSLHSVVGMDFAASLMPGWQETIFPPYFVVGAMYSGFAMVVVLLPWCAGASACKALITIAHFDVIAKVMLAAAIIMGLSYANEWFTAWYGSDRADRSLLVFEFAGAYAPMYLGIAALQCRHPATVLVLRGPHATSSPSSSFRGIHQYRHVARAHPDHLEHAFTRLHA